MCNVEVLVQLFDGFIHRQINSFTCCFATAGHNGVTVSSLDHTDYRLISHEFRKVQP